MNFLFASARILSASLRVGAGAAPLLLAACAQMPTGPTVPVMPGPYKPFDVFVAEDHICRDWAYGSIGGTVSANASQQAFAAPAVTGTAIGAAAGALADGSSGAGVGAALGLVTGAAVGSSQSGWTAYDAQRRYDIAYQQCMYAKGNQLPGGYSQGSRSYASPTPMPPAGIQPPPAASR